MTQQRWRAPVWLMGVTMLPFGIMNGIIPVTVPQLLAARHVPESGIATLTTLAFSPAFWGFIASPILDVRFSRRAYAIAGTVATAALVTLALLNLRHAVVLAVLLLLADLCAVLMQGALGGWFAGVVADHDRHRLSAWMMVTNLGGAGLTVVVAAPAFRSLPGVVAAPLVGVAVLLSLLIYPFIPFAGNGARLARESFRRFFAEAVALSRRREVRLAIAMFILPTAPFALTNVLGGLGADFHASLQNVSIAGGIGLSLAGIAGSLVLPPLARRWPARPLYIAIGAVGAIFTLALLLLPHVAGVLDLAFAGERVFQAMAFTCAFAIIFQTLGHDNPLAATTFSVLVAASNLPVIYMIDVDGHAFQRFGIAGGFITDAALSLLSCLLLAALLLWLRVRGGVRAGRA